MVGPTLLDVAAITSLPVHLPEVTSNLQPNQTYKMTSKTSYSDFIDHHMGHKNDLVTDKIECSIFVLLAKCHNFLFKKRSDAKIISLSGCFVTSSILIEFGQVNLRTPVRRTWPPNHLSSN
ncbi:hypothetical protein AAHE18_03G230100 [Arachis hypogaea]